MLYHFFLFTFNTFLESIYRRISDYTHLDVKSQRRELRYNEFCLVGAAFVGTIFVGTVLVGTVLVGTTLVGTVLVWTALLGTTLVGIAFVGTQLLILS